MYFNEVTNSPSLRKTSSFTEFLLTDAARKEIATYTEDVTVTNAWISNITEFKLVQKTKQPDVET